MTHAVVVNGGIAETFSSVIGEKIASVELDIRDLRFARPGPPGKDSVPGENEIRIIPGANSFPKDAYGKQLCGDFRNPGFAPVSLEFAALAPVILVHGNAESAAFFDKHDFLKPFRDRKMVFRAISYRDPGIISTNVRQLLGLVDESLKSFG